MNRTEFIEHIGNLYAEGVQLIEKKNADYASGEDPFQNFRQSAIAGVTPERAILVRIADKIARISNCLGKEVQVTDEQVTDTIVDAINYLGILHALISNENAKRS